MAFQTQPVTAAEAFVRGGRGRLRTLVVCAAPLGPGMPLNLRKEWEQLRRHSEESRAPVTLFRLLPPTRQAFENTLQLCSERRVTPHIVHFAGHGQSRHLCFEDELGGEARFQREDLAAALREHGVPVITLNACHTATLQTISLARYLVDENAVEVAVGHREPVADSSALAFAGEFYRQLCSGEEAYLAFVQARSLLSQTDSGAAASIELFGNDSLRLSPDQTEDPGARIFDGTYGRGRIPVVPAFFGREQEMVKLAKILADESLPGVALVGIGGIGKTTIALELANRNAWRYPGGVAFASARSTGFNEPSAAELVRSVASDLLVPIEGGPIPEERLLSHLRQLEFQIGEQQTGIARVREAEAVLRELGSGDLNQIVEILTTMDSVHSYGLHVEPLLAQAHDALTSDHPAGAAALAAEALECAKQIDNQQGEAYAAFLLAQALLAMARFQEAVELLLQTRGILTSLGQNEEAAAVTQLLEEVMV